MFIRGGRNLGSTQFFPRAPLGDPGEITECLPHAVLLHAGSPAARFC